MDNFERYDAFISYRHLEPDITMARKLQELLEKYNPPKSVNCKRTRKIKKIFRDRSDLPTSGNLGDDLKDALEKSDFLIVICSPEFKESKWCMREVEYFKEIHNGSNQNILTLLVNGTPNDSIPEILRHETKLVAVDNGENLIEQVVESEPLAANVADGDSVNKKKKMLRVEFLRIAAPLFGCKFDDLYNRHRRRHIKNTIRNSALLASLLLVMLWVLCYRNKQVKTLEEQAKYDANIQYLNVAENLIDNGDKLLGNTVLMELVDTAVDRNGFVNEEYERILSKGVYVPQYGQYGTLRVNDEIDDIIISEDKGCVKILRWD